MGVVGGSKQGLGVWSFGFSFVQGIVKEIFFNYLVIPKAL